MFDLSLEFSNLILVFSALKNSFSVSRSCILEWRVRESTLAEFPIYVISSSSMNTCSSMWWSFAFLVSVTSASMLLITAFRAAMLLLCLGVSRELSEFLLFRRGVLQLVMLSLLLSDFLFRSVGTAWSGCLVHMPSWSAFFFTDFVLFADRHNTAASRFLEKRFGIFKHEQWLLRSLVN